jgi:hypothetical protein
VRRHPLVAYPSVDSGRRRLTQHANVL